MEFAYENVNEAFYGMVSGIAGGDIATTKSTSRNGLVLHIPGVTTITYRRPTQRVLFNSARDCNPFFHLYESLWMLAGRNDIEPLAFYASNMRNFSDDGATQNGAYGYRWREHPRRNDEDEMNYGTVDQLTYLIEHLRQLPDSRRAVLQMWNVEDDLLKIGGGTDTVSKDVCCNLSVLFSISGSETVRPFTHARRLDMTVFNRSNDLIWGTFGANAVHFSFLQEYIACCLGVEVGIYNQVSNNQHVYLHNWKPKEWLESKDQTMMYPESRAPIPLVENRERFDKEVRKFTDHFIGTPSGLDGVMFEEPFLTHVAKPMCAAFCFHKVREYDAAATWLARVKATDWQLAGRAWIRKRMMKWQTRAEGATS